LTTEDLLIALLGQEQGVAFEVLVMREISLDVVRGAIDDGAGHGEQARGGGGYSTIRRVLELSLSEALELGHQCVGTGHLLLGLVDEGNSRAARVLAKLGVQPRDLRDQLRNLGEVAVEAENGAMVAGFGWNLTGAARAGRLGRVIGRDREVEEVMGILRRRTKNCPVLLGEPGVDKVAVVKGLAAMTAGPAPRLVRDKIVLAVDPAAVQDEDFVNAVAAAGNVILFVDGIHTLDGDRLRTLLDKEFQLIGGTTSDDYHRMVLDSRFVPVEVGEPSVAAAVELLEEQRERFEAHHQVTITRGALVAAAVLAQRFVTEELLPESGLELLDKAGAKLQKRGGSEVDEELIVEIVAERVRLSEKRVRAALPSAAAEVVLDVEPDYALLADQPVDSDDDDLLGTAAVARGIATILTRAASPFVLAVDGSWGAGKSTLLRQIEAALPDEMVKIKFNAWTAQGENALDALMKSVIGKLDRNILRRRLRMLAAQQHLTRIARAGLAVGARFLGMPQLIDMLWTRLQANDPSRNELRATVAGMLADWAKQQRKARRTLVVFIDDLDRCPDDVVVAVCEAVKLYLDAPGLVFVIGCDLSVLARGVAAKARGGEGEGRTYLEKIVQVVHRVPAPDQDGVAKLILGYADRAGITALIDDAVVDILSTRTGRNPRRIKRIVNSFVLEHYLNPVWRRPPLGSAQLIAVIILQHLYPRFYERLAGDGAGTDDDPISEFLDYATVRARSNDSPGPSAGWWTTASRVFRRYGVAPPVREAGQDLRSDIERFEAILPPWFPELALNEAFLVLLREIGGGETRRAVRAQLVNRPLGTSAFPEADSGH
jgi:hypothetical protein